MARVGLIDSGGSKQCVRDGVGVTAPVLTDGTATFTASGENRGGVKTTFSSALKNTDLQTNSSGAVTAERQYDAFGNVIASTGAWTSQFGNAGRFRYQEDPDSGLKLLGHRYYDSATGRFLTRDPVGDGRNWYVYCGSDPVNFYDDFGLAAQQLLDSPPQLAVVPGGAAAAGMAGGTLGAGLLAGIVAILGWEIGTAIDNSTGISDRILGALYPTEIGSELSPKVWQEIEAKKRKRKKLQTDQEKDHEHTSKKRPSTKGKHEKGRARKKRDRRGGEKGDERRPYLFFLDDEELRDSFGSEI